MGGNEFFEKILKIFWRRSLRRVGVRADRRRPRLPMEHRPGVNLRSARIAAVSAAEDF
jgi:hypothetical protein